jgi:hypothetical protein
MIEERNGWRIKTSGSAAGLPIAAEYLCPEHGRFTVDVTRDEKGDAPAEAKCTAQVLGPGAPFVLLACGEWSPFVISAPRARVKLVEVVRGKYQKPEFDTWTNTENLGEGQDLDDWIADRDKVWERDRENSIKELLDEQ